MKVGDKKYLWGVFKVEVTKVYPYSEKFGQKIEVSNQGGLQEEYAPKVHKILVSPEMLDDKMGKHSFKKTRDPVKV